ncbi:hypothetical protein [Telluribacter humicola]|uniref:hypothetical protein n=1 Tax=Telluribacter humicola TaxID=1720261 RepID=UPI001A9736BA|nr:hypothetical protein [Telluribacter humicola]
MARTDESKANEVKPAAVAPSDPEKKEATIQSLGEGAAASAANASESNPPVQAPEVPQETPQKSARERYEELPYSATVVYECDGPDTKTVDGESEVVTKKLTPSCTKGHWEGLPRHDKGSRKGQPMHLTNARLIGFIDGGELVKLEE